MSEDTERVTKLLNDIEVLVSDLFLGHRNFSPTEHCGRIQHALGEARHALATAEASAAAVGAQVREEALLWAYVNPPEEGEGDPNLEDGPVFLETDSEYAQRGCRALPLPSGAEALAARDRATAERAVLATLRHSRLGLYASALNPDATVPGFADEILSELFPASGRTTTEGG